MEYTLRPLELFLQDIDELSPQGRRVLERKLELVKMNPFRNKRLAGFGLFLFRIRFEDSRQEKRAVYLVDKPDIILICILDRDKDYKDLRPMLLRLGYL